MLLTQFLCTFTNANELDYRYQKAFKVQRLSLAEGLSQSVVNDIIQDQDGYIWMATEDGLNRFDSYDFKVFRHDHRNKKSLHENTIISLLEEPGFGIWVGTVAGLSFYNPIDQSFTDYSKLNKDLSSWIYNFHYSQNNIAWIAAESGLFYVDRKQGKVVVFVSAENEKINETVLSITESKESIYAATPQCVYQINKSTRKLNTLCDKLTMEPLIDSKITEIKSQGDYLWIGTESGLFRYDTQNDSIKSYLNDINNKNSISDNYIQDFVLDKNNAIWIATTKGLNFYNSDREIFEHFGEQNYTNEGLSSNDVISLFVDNQDLLWLGTYGGGVNMLDPNQHQFEHLLNNAEVLNIGNNNIIHGIEKDQYDSLWLASYGGGLIKYNLLTGVINRPLNDNAIEYDEFVWSIFIDHSNHLWTASLEEFNIIDLERNKKLEIELLVDGKKEEMLKGINRFYEDQTGMIWIGTGYGLYKVKNIQKTNKVWQIDLTNLTSNLPSSFTHYDSSISTMTQDKNGDFWFGGTAGLVYYRVELDEWSHFSYDQEKAQSLSNNNVQVIFEDSQNFIWIGTADGLNRVVRSNIDANIFYFERITTYEGLPNNAIYGILEDKDKQIWLSTTQGLVKYVHTAKNMEIFKSIDGLSSDEFNTGAYFSDSNGKLYFGSINGITIVNNLSKKPKNDNRKIIFTKVTIGDRDVDVYLLNHSSKPTITQHSNEPAIDLTVASISYNKLGTQRYRYKIPGIDKQWKYLGINKKIFIAGLPEGEYELEIQSKLSGNDWFGQKYNMRIIVETSFWNSRQGYFVIGIMLLLLFSYILFLLAHFYKRKIEKTKRKMNIELLRIRELRSDNDSLKRELNNKGTEVDSLNKKIRLIEKAIGFEKYRDATTGFYRLNYLFSLDEQNTNDKYKIITSTGFNCYQSMAIFELNNYLSIHDKMGPVAAAELASKVSILMRQKMDAGTEMFCVQKGIFLILNTDDEYQAFEDNVLNLRLQVVRSEYDIANGLSGNSEVTLTVCNIEKFKINTKSKFISKINLLVNCHKELAEEYAGKCIRLIMNSNDKEFGEENYDRSLIDLLDNNLLSIEKIN